MRARISYANVTATLALVLVLGGVAVASIPGPDGRFHGCYANSGGGLRIVDSGAACRVGESRITFSQTGPQGPAGVPGPQGERGPSGQDSRPIVGAIIGAIVAVIAAIIVIIGQQETKSKEDKAELKETKTKLKRQERKLRRLLRCPRCLQAAG